MKKRSSVLSFLFLLFTANWLFAQTVVPVPALTPDALFNAVAAANSGDILELASGGIYPNTATITTTKNLTIRTAPGFTAKARCVPSANSSGGFASPYILANANITIQNVIFDLKQPGKQAWGGNFLNRATTGIPGGAIVLDGVEIYKAGAYSGGGNVDTLIMKNCFFSGQIRNAGGWGSPFSMKGCKYIEITNNTSTFNLFTSILGNDGWGNNVIASNKMGTVIIDHNTFYNIAGDHGASLMISRTDNVVVTNNLFYNPSWRPIEHFSDKYLDYPQNYPDCVEVGTGLITIGGGAPIYGPKGLWIFSYEMGDSATSNLLIEANNIAWDDSVLNMWTRKGLKPLHKWTYYTSKLARNASGVKDSTKAWMTETLAFTDAQRTPLETITTIADTTLLYESDLAKYAKKTNYAGVVNWDLATLNPTWDFRMKDGATPTAKKVNMAYPTTAKSYKAGVYTPQMQALGVKGAAGYPLGDLNWFPSLKANWEKGIALTGVQQQDGVPVTFDLAQNYPNPFNPTTNINFSIPQSGLVTLKVFNLLGQEVATLVNQNMLPGKYSVDFNASELSSGVFVYQLTAGTFTSTKKMMLLK